MRSLGYITDDQLARSIMVPLACPQTELRKGSSILLASFYVDTGESFRIRWVTLYVPRLVATHGAFEKIADRYGPVYVGLYSGLETIQPTGTPIFSVSADGVQHVTSSPYLVRNFSAKGIYSLLAVNNTRYYDYDVVVTGAARYFLESNQILFQSL